MTDELNRTLERVRQGRAGIGRELGTAAPLVGAPASAAAGSVRLGARVFDVVTGLEGEVVDVLEQIGIIPAGAHVRLSNGALIYRDQARLVVRPTLPGPV